MFAWIIAIWQRINPMSATVTEIAAEVKAQGVQLAAIEATLTTMSADLATILQLLTTPDNVASFKVTVSQPVKQ
jgi:hypothetical protein